MSNEKRSGPDRSSRRDFLKSATAVSAGALLAQGVHTSAHAAESNSPNEKLNLGFVGTSGRAKGNMKELTQENIYALCDVWQDAIDAAKKDFLDGKHKAKEVSDWRRLIDDKAIDAVVVSNTDHHHALCAVAAMRAGKHVYCEKPLSHTVHEARVMQDEYKSRRDKIATQMGTQIHAGDNFRRVVEMVRSGAIGPVRVAHVWCSRDPEPVPRDLAEEKIPTGFNWDVWLGPAEMRPYNQQYWQGGCTNWNRRWDFGNGVLGDMSGHLVDLPFWALALHRPTTVEATGSEPDAVACPDWLKVTWEHDKRDMNPDVNVPLQLHWYHGPEGVAEFRQTVQPQIGDDYDLKRMGQGAAFIGDQGIIVANYTRRMILPKSKFADYEPPEQIIPASLGHHREWTHACKTGEPTTCNFDYSGALIEHNLLGMAAYQSGKKLNWDPDALRFSNAPEADQFLSKSYRKGWEF